MEVGRTGHFGQVALLPAGMARLSVNGGAQTQHLLMVDQLVQDLVQSKNRVM